VKVNGHTIFLETSRNRRIKRLDKNIKISLAKEGFKRWMEVVQGRIQQLYFLFTTFNVRSHFVSPLSIGIYPIYAHSICSCVNEAYFVYVFKIGLLTVRT
jgi:hypothetical protein